MPRRPAAFTQADIARTIRAGKQEGATGVELLPNGSIFIHLERVELALSTVPSQTVDDDVVVPL